MMEDDPDVQAVLATLRPILPIPLDKQIEFCRIIANGEHDFDLACAQASIPESDFNMAQSFDNGFREKLHDAIQKRGDHWHSKIIKDVDHVPDKDYASGEKLRFEKLKYLAEIDNPDKYGKKTKTTVDINHNIVHSLKRMTQEEARKILEDDPFSLPVKTELIPEAEVVEKPKRYSL